MAKVYLDTSVVIALANPRDEFHDASLRFIRGLQELRIAPTIGPPLLLEVGKAVQRKGVESALAILLVIDRYKIESAAIDSSRLLNLVDRYVAHRVAGRKYRLDLLHYASATLLNCSHLASWDKEHFNQRTGERINKANSLIGLATLKVGDPIHIGRALGLG